MADEPAKDAPAKSARSDQIQHFRASIEAIRKNADASAKALSALGTSGLAFLGVNKFADVFPLPDHSWRTGLVVVAAVVGFGLVAWALFSFTRRIWRVNAPVVLSPSRDQITKEAGKGSKAAKRSVGYYDKVALLNSAPSLEAYAARGRRFERIAESLPSGNPQRERLEAIAADIDETVHATMAVAAVDIVRDRAAGVVRGKKTSVLVAAFVIGVVAIALSGDYLDGKRAGELKLAQDCATAGKALGEQVVAARALPAVCDGEPEKGAATSEGDRALALANKCAVTVAALGAQGLDAYKLTGEKGPCPAAKPTVTTRAAAVAGAIGALLDRAKTCELAAEPGACQPLYDLIAQARRKATEPPSP